jgi:transposase
VLEELNIKNRAQLKVWMKWHREGAHHRLHQPVGKQYAFGKGPDYASETDQLQAEIRCLKQQIDVLKKYNELERKWLEARSSNWSKN